MLILFWIHFLFFVFFTVRMKYFLIFFIVSRSRAVPFFETRRPNFVSENRVMCDG